MTAGAEPVRIGNCSGFYGDRVAAMHEMLTGGDLDYLTGDYLAELTEVDPGDAAIVLPPLVTVLARRPAAT